MLINYKNYNRTHRTNINNTHIKDDVEFHHQCHTPYFIGEYINLKKFRPVLSVCILSVLLLLFQICTSATVRPYLYTGFGQFGNVRPTPSFHLDPIVGPDFGISDYKVYDYSIYNKYDSVYSYSASSLSDFGDRYKYQPLTVYAVSSDNWSDLPRSDQRAEVYYRRRPNVQVKQFCKRF